MRKLLISSLLAGSLLALPASAQNNASKIDANGHEWWQHAVFYEVYPRSFADSNGDGVGDLNGIASKVPYLQDLGVDAIWLTPCFPSPQVDFGYDVSDYENIDPMYGTLADFDKLQKTASDHNIKIILDLVVNHTSDKHQWFLDSESSKKNPKRDWFIWRDGKGPGKPPNNWTSTFGGSAWKLDPKTNQYYYHYFYAEQPDLNWRNNDVRDAMFDVTRWWYKRGVAGFRLDAVDTLFEDPNLKDNPVLPGKNKFGDPNTDEINNKRFPEVHQALQGLRKVADDYNAVLIGETWTKDINELKAYYGTGARELQMPMDFMFTQVKPLAAAQFRARVAEIDAAGGWPVFVISNHDMVRAATRWGDGKHNAEINKMMAAFYLTLRGTPIMYYGEELGMENTDPTRKEDVKDPIGRTGWPKEKGRDGERTPMQWNSEKNAGFSTSDSTWLPVPPNYKTRNVEAESKDPDSVLSFYKQVLALRHKNQQLLEGSYASVTDDPNVVAYLRPYQDKAVLVVLNMSAIPKKMRLDLTNKGFTATAMTLVTSMKNTPAQVNTKEIALTPYGAYIGEVAKQ
ncbi:alpha amylase [Candidatus Koribacter versatilis Ellin345]|uniref:Alpha amylase n=1 Tax=Koribacter versatilis (strain Ellin345) TaxID=204669 RepID=Q1IT76_KORVE|nr:alpha-glucosidase [Candidatus Koribacter versatilis]ABF39924.1 alpha amylase [Candidatus Koribacter versatilis Ellin345]